VTPEKALSGQADGETKYRSLVEQILWEFDNSSKLAERVGGGSPQLQGEIRGYQSILDFLRGFEGTDLDGLRAKFGRVDGPARSAPVEE
jgi:hypothetical protein